MKKGACIFGLLALLSALAAAHNSHASHGYSYGDAVRLECVDVEGGWGGAPTCLESKEPMGLRYGVDASMHCAWRIEHMEWVKQLIRQQKAWACRVRMSPEHEFYVPFSLPLWGVVEADHSHIDNHLNFVLHADRGRIIGAAAYPVRDRFAVVREGTVLNLHGTAKWFAGASFSPLNARAFKVGDDKAPVSAVSATPLEIFFLLALSFTLSVVGGVLVYQLRLKPALVKKLVKKD